MPKLILALSVYWVVCAIPAYLSMRKGMFSAWPFYLVAIVLSPLIMPGVWIESLFNPPKKYSMPALNDLQASLRKDAVDGMLFTISLTLMLQ